jgi:hypothetical protein
MANGELRPHRSIVRHAQGLASSVHYSQFTIQRYPLRALRALRLGLKQLAAQEINSPP